MQKEYANIFTNEQCSAIANSIISLKNKGLLDFEDDRNYYKNSMGVMNLPATLELLHVVEPLIRVDNSNICFENTYTRIYQNGSYLKIHTDRPDLFLTLSICVYSDVGSSWPLHVSNVLHHGPWSVELPTDRFLENYSTFDTPVGSGVTCDGLTHPHWRDTLICQPDQMVIQTFYHWNKAWSPRSSF